MTIMDTYFDAKPGTTNIYGNDLDGWTLAAVDITGEWFNVSTHATKKGALEAQSDFRK